MTLISVFQEVSKDDFSREIKGFKPIKTNDVFLMFTTGWSKCGYELTFTTPSKTTKPSPTGSSRGEMHWGPTIPTVDPITPPKPHTHHDQMTIKSSSQLLLSGTKPYCR